MLRDDNRFRFTRANSFSRGRGELPMSVRECAECGSVVPSAASLCPVCAAPFAPLESGRSKPVGRDEPTTSESDVTAPARSPGTVLGFGPEPVELPVPVDDERVAVTGPEVVIEPDRVAELDRLTEPDDGHGSDGPSTGPEPRRAFLRAMLVAAVVSLAIALGAGGVLWLVRDDADVPGADPSPGQTHRIEDDPGAGTDAPSSDPASADPWELTPSPSESPAVVGIVTIEAGVVDARAAEVARTFDAYFSAVNNRNYPAAAAMFDPAGDVLDPDDGGAVERFGRQLVTTHDSDVVLRSLTDVGQGVVAAVVTFRSTQDPGYGPKNRPQETCTLWQVRYELSTTSSGTYRILRSKSAVPSRPCAA
ncbi:hypothetical protein F6X54_29915 [Micromonospora aurantiaca]|uniref:Zinc ribbon domain-containing protein n=1 Tax=Micromonospora aurantiaca (nom. illeg.) TaxID=47850 RepID=A0ABQ6U7Z1_9ACTN|nr:hypothetical protein [Micromonospora aurantiaca]KAB1102988.1 hypothetical protein F6X54_29915 [Micromonospora aurantiaca]